MKVRRRTALLASVVVVALLIGAAMAASMLRAQAPPPEASPYDVNGPNVPAKEPGNWPAPAGNLAGQRFSDLKGITPDNATGLQVSWMMSLATLRGLEGQPLIVGDTLYMVSSYPNKVYAVDLATREMKWQWSPVRQQKRPIVDNQMTFEENQKDPAAHERLIRRNSAAVQTACCDVINRGISYAAGKIVLQTLNAYVTVLDADTGKLVWERRNANPRVAETSTAAPIVAGDKIIAGMSGGEYGVRGYLTAYDLETGKRAWRAYSVGPDSDLLPSREFIAKHGVDSSTRSWEGGREDWIHGGGAPWGWYSYDVQQRLVIYTTGNPGPWNPDQRPGDNKWTLSMMARDVDTGRLKWAYQFTPHDQWDYDSSGPSILADVNVSGKKVPAVIHFDKNSFAYVLDRRDGTLLAAHPFDRNQNVFAGVDMTTGRPIVNPDKETHEGRNTENICPSAMGSIDMQPPAFDRASGLVMVPTNNICMDYQPFPVEYEAGQPFVGAIVRMYEGPPGPQGDFGGTLTAFDPMTGKFKYQIYEDWPVWSGVLTTAGGVTYYGTQDGYFKAVDTATGKLLRQFKMPSSVIGAPIAYTTPSGEEEVAVFAGVGGWPGEFMALGDTGPTDDLGAVNYFGYNRHTATNAEEPRPLQDTVNRGGDIVVFHVPAKAAGAAGTGGGWSLPVGASWLIAGGAAIVLAASLLLVMGRRWIPRTLRGRRVPDGSTVRP
jgi:PQQ-dependent dehydrogenase (methanol/ethanol family)